MTLEGTILLMDIILSWSNGIEKQATMETNIREPRSLFALLNQVTILPTLMCTSSTHLVFPHRVLSTAIHGGP